MKKKKSIPYFAIGNDELVNKPKLGKTLICKHCGKKHKVKYATDVEGKPTQLAFYDCGKTTYLCGINGKYLGT